ncbi:MAG: hypothetical protein HYZ17_03895 [Betaproteobacteria bacterium]|nr:hypothetical protein [Betaproteobacteria bacterium]
MKKTSLFALLMLLVACGYKGPLTLSQPAAAGSAAVPAQPAEAAPGEANARKDQEQK